MKIEADQTLSTWLEIQARIRPDATALIDGEGALSYIQLSGAVSGLCSGLAELGIGKGDVVGVQLPNVRSFVIAFLAVTARGGIFQTLHMPYRAKELQGLLSDAKAKAALVTNSEQESRAQDVLSVQDALPDLDHIIVAGSPPEGCVSLAKLMTKPANPADLIAASPEDSYLLLYTSGTTAAPKGVPHIYRNFLNNALLSSREMKIDDQSRILSLAPMSHLYGLFTMHLALASGAAMVLLPAFNPQTLLDDLQSSEATHIYAAPAHFAPFVAQNLLTAEHLRSARLLCLSGAAVPQVLAEAVDAKMAKSGVIQLWGMSELQAGTFGRPNDPAEKRHSTAGAAAPHMKLRIIGDDGAVLGPGQEGALQVRGPSVFAGYLNRPEETERAFTEDQWFETGDLAKIDAEGFMTFTGRTKELINRGGVKYNPIEVEEVLSGLPAIQQCAVVPVPDPELGERGCLCVELVPGNTLTMEDVSKRLATAGMAKYKWPERLVILDALPITPTRKVMRGTLSTIVEDLKD